MIELNDVYLKKIDRASSKGNQLKWCFGNVWYKADYNGYEGLSEYVVSKLLEKSTLKKEEYVSYDLEQIKYKNVIMNGCKSNNFLKDGDKLITVKRLINAYSKESFDEIYNSFVTTHKKAKYIIDTVIRITNLKDFGEYLYKLCVIDAIFLNEDRHLHNIAIIQKQDNSFKYCPIFDNGASLLSDTQLDYPMNGNVIDMIKTVRSKTFDDTFMNIIDSLESDYSTNISFSYTEKDIENVLNSIDIYDEKIIKRIKQVLIYQKNKMAYFF